MIKKNVDVPCHTSRAYLENLASSFISEKVNVYI